jgi:hypothetical protein
MVNPGPHPRPSALNPHLINGSCSMARNVIIHTLIKGLLLDGLHLKGWTKTKILIGIS